MIPLYNPNTYYFLSNNIHGLKNQIKIADFSRRFDTIGDWYIKVKRVWRNQ